MAKKRSYRKKKAQLKDVLAPDEMKLGTLEELRHYFTGSDKVFVRDLLATYRRKGSLTPNQWEWVSKMVARGRRIRHLAGDEEKFYLYAIEGERDVRLGFSTDVHQRRRELQVSRSDELRIFWTCLVPGGLQEAKKAERKLHRFLKDQHIRGEWFHPECLERIRDFKVAA